MKKNMLNLLAVSMIVLSSVGLNAAQCSASDNQKKVTLVNNSGVGVVLVALTIAPGSTFVRGYGIPVSNMFNGLPSGETREIPYCTFTDHGDFFEKFVLIDFSAIIPTADTSQAENVEILISGILQEDGSYTNRNFMNAPGATNLDFADLFKQLRSKKSGNLIITVEPTTAGGPIATAQIK